MKITIINNGVTSLVLVPETEIEKLQLKELSNKEVKVASYEQTVQILNTPVPNALVISTIKEKEDEILKKNI